MQNLALSLDSSFMTNVTFHLVFFLSGITLWMTLSLLRRPEMYFKSLPQPVRFYSSSLPLCNPPCCCCCWRWKQMDKISPCHDSSRLIFSRPVSTDFPDQQREHNSEIYMISSLSAKWARTCVVKIFSSHKLRMCQSDKSQKKKTLFFSPLPPLPFVTFFFILSCVGCHTLVAPFFPPSYFTIF